MKQGEKATRAWSPRFESGVSQIVDCFYKLQVMTDSPDMEARFGKRSTKHLGVMIIGREQHLQLGERLRLEWRHEHVVVNSKHIVCVTYDQLVVDLLFHLDSDTTMVKGSGKP